MYLLYFIHCNVSFEANFVPRDSPGLRVVVWAVESLPFLPAERSKHRSRECFPGAPGLIGVVEVLSWSCVSFGPHVRQIKVVILSG